MSEEQRAQILRDMDKFHLEYVSIKWRMDLEELRSLKPKLPVKMKKTDSICVMCGGMFRLQRSRKRIVCGMECLSAYYTKTRTGKPHPHKGGRS